MTRSPKPLDQRPLSGSNAELNVNSARRFLTKQFEQAELGDCEAESRDLVMAATGLTREELITHGTKFISPEAINLLQNYSGRRLSGEPIDHILGWREFYGRRFKVNSDVLSPRQETEEVVAKALEFFVDIKSPHILDLGTGSGAIAVTLLAEMPSATALAVDYSRLALNTARENAASHGVAPRLTLSQSDWFKNVAGGFDLIVSNPPYIDAQAMAELPPEVSKFDPELSLHGGVDGLDPYRIIAAQARNFLKPDGVIVFEIGYDQGEAVPQILMDNGYGQVNLFHDLAGLPRIVTARDISA